MAPETWRMEAPFECAEVEVEAGAGAAVWVLVSTKVEVLGIKGVEVTRLNEELEETGVLVDVGVLVGVGVEVGVGVGVDEGEV